MTMVEGHIRRLVTVPVIAALAAGGIWGGLAATSASTSSAAGARAAGSTGLASVVRADLAAQQTISGTVGYSGAWTVVLPAGTTAPAVAQAQVRVTTDQLALAADRTSLQDATATDADATTANQQAVSAAQAAVAVDEAQLLNDQASLRVAQARAASLCAPTSQAAAGACTVGWQAVSQLEAKINADSQAAGHDQAALQQASFTLTAALRRAAVTEHQGETQIAGAEITLAADQAALAACEQAALAPGATFTGVPAAGQVVHQGQALYALDGHSVPLLYGAVPQWRAFRSGMADGPDVAELNRALTALGFESGTTGVRFTDATAVGIRRLQDSLGLAQTGALLVGEVVFEPSPLHIASVNVNPGGPAQPGTTVLSATSTTLTVTALVPLNYLGSVNPGAPVTVDLPNGRTGVSGVVRDVGASVSSASVSGQGGGGGDAGGGTNGAGGGQGNPSTVPATVTFSDPTVARGLDRAAVLVHVTTQTAHGVLAVPVEALLALDGGGEGVEMVASGVHRIVAVQTGLFSGTQVQITGPGITAGAQVEVPAS
jgi:multidrug efflux pump subunit AcrA (membrane-fusion protein)